MANNEIYEAPWSPNEDPKQLDAFSWLRRNGYPVAKIYDYVQEMENILLEEAHKDLIAKLANTGFMWGINSDEKTPHSPEEMLE